MNPVPSPRPRRIPCLIPVLCFVLLLALAAVPAAANPPSAMSLSYDPVASVLSVTITHPAAGMQGHYIGDVKISVNGNPAGDTKYTGQPSDTFTYTYPLVLRPGDTVDVTATCSLAGSASRSYTVPAAASSPATGQPAPSPIPTQKSPVLLITALAGLSIGLVIRRFR